MSALQSPRAELGFPYDADDGHIGTGTDNSSENFNSLPNVPQELEMNTVSVVPDGKHHSLYRGQGKLGKFFWQIIFSLCIVGFESCLRRMQTYAILPTSIGIFLTFYDLFYNPEMRKDAFTVRQAINTFGFGKFQAKLSLFTGLCWMADSMEMTILSILTPALYCIWSISRYQQAMLTMVVFLGMMVSPPFWEHLSEKYGRKKALMVCAFSLICCGLASSFSTSYLWMFFLRGLVGLTVGCVPQSVTLYAEYLPSKQRAKCVVLLDCFWALGACFEVVLALLLMPTQGWTWLLVFSTTPIIAFACICPWLPDSARFFLLQGKTDEAFAILRTVASENNKSMLLGRLVIEDGSNDDKGSVRDLLVPRLRNISLRLWLIWSTCSFCYYGVVLMSTELLAIYRNHVMVSNGHAISISGNCVPLDTQDYMDLLWTTFAEFPGILMTVFVIEKCGHKNTMAIQFGLFAFCCALLTQLWTSKYTLIPLLLIARGVIAGVFQAAYLYTPEVYTSGLRSVGLSTCSVFARLGAVFTPLVSQVLLHSSLAIGISVYGTVAVISAIACVLLPYDHQTEPCKTNPASG